MLRPVEGKRYVAEFRGEQVECVFDKVRLIRDGVYSGRNEFGEIVADKPVFHCTNTKTGRKFQLNNQRAFIQQI